MPSFLVLRLEAPLMSFGREAIDANGPTRDFPDASMLTGLLTNALGYTRSDAVRHQRLQDRLVFGVRIDRLGYDLHDFQTAQLSKRDLGWTTRGEPEGRAGGENTYDSPHIRFRHYRADAALTVALRLDPANERPTLDDLAAALDHPARPLFIGRKSCLPSASFFVGMSDAESLIAALQSIPTTEPSIAACRFVLPPSETIGLGNPEIVRVTNKRDWSAGVHAGEERITIITLPAQAGGGARV
jgi:CRISPR system Cascade subunit CasD